MFGNYSQLNTKPMFCGYRASKNKQLPLQKLGLVCLQTKETTMETPVYRLRPMAPTEGNQVD
jgi:hypothetical protein